MDLFSKGIVFFSSLFSVLNTKYLNMSFFSFYFESYIDVKAYILENNLKPSVDANESENIKTTPSLSSTSQITSMPKHPLASSEQNEVDYEDIELSNMRKVIAKRLLFSKVNRIIFFKTRSELTWLLFVKNQS
jgi:hypothetical protein